VGGEQEEEEERDGGGEEGAGGRRHFCRAASHFRWILEGVRGVFASRRLGTAAEWLTRPAPGGEGGRGRRS
jgi:hypothetical protein